MTASIHVPAESAATWLATYRRGGMLSAGERAEATRRLAAKLVRAAA